MKLPTALCRLLAEFVHGDVLYHAVAEYVRRFANFYIECPGGLRHTGIKVGDADMKPEFRTGQNWTYLGVVPSMSATKPKIVQSESGQDWIYVCPFHMWPVEYMRLWMEMMTRVCEDPMGMISRSFKVRAEQRDQLAAFIADVFS